MKNRICKVCKNIYEPRNKGQSICSVTCALKYVKKKNREEFVKQTRALKKKYYNTDRKHLTKKAQKVFNEYIRMRDNGNACISCGWTAQCQWHAGHYRASGSAPALRFEPLNCNLQCAQCNLHKSGNLTNYRIGLIKKIGLEKVKWIEGTHPVNPISIEKLKKIYKKYSKLISEMTRGGSLR